MRKEQEQSSVRRGSARKSVMSSGRLKQSRSIKSSENHRDPEEKLLHCGKQKWVIQARGERERETERIWTELAERQGPVHSM